MAAFTVGSVSIWFSSEMTATVSVEEGFLSDPMAAMLCLFIIDLLRLELLQQTSLLGSIYECRNAQYSPNDFLFS